MSIKSNQKAKTYLVFFEIAKTNKAFYFFLEARDPNHFRVAGYGLFSQTDLFIRKCCCKMLLNSRVSCIFIVPAVLRHGLFPLILQFKKLAKLLLHQFKVNVLLKDEIKSLYRIGNRMHEELLWTHWD